MAEEKLSEKELEKLPIHEISISKIPHYQEKKIRMQ